MSPLSRFLPVWAGLGHLVVAMTTPGSRYLWDVLLYNGLLACSAIWATYKREWIIALAIASWTFGSIFSAYSLWSSLGYLLIYPLLFFYILNSQQLKALTKPQILDSLIIALGISSLLASVALSATSNARSSLEVFLLTLYPIGDLLLIASLILVGIKNGMSGEYFLLMSVIIIFTISDLGYLYLFSTNSYAVGGVVDEGWLIALLILTLSPKLSQKRTRALNTYPAIFLALGLSLSILGWFSLRPSQNSNFALLPAIITLLLAFIRMAIALDEAEQGKIHQELSVTDELTGVGNRRDFFARLDKLPRDGSWALLLLDLNRFKEVNDIYGHSAGDLVLREVAHRFTSVLPDGSYLARLGGDEFAALVERGERGAHELGERLQLALTTPIYIGDSPLSVRVSIGITAITEIENPLERADGQMYLEKRKSQ